MQIKGESMQPEFVSFKDLNYNEEIKKILTLRGNPAKGDVIKSSWVESAGDFETLPDFIRNINATLVAAFELSARNTNLIKGKPLDEQLLLPGPRAILQTLLSIEIAKQKGLIKE